MTKNCGSVQNVEMQILKATLFGVRSLPHSGRENSEKVILNCLYEFQVLYVSIQNNGLQRNETKERMKLQLQHINQDEIPTSWLEWAVQEALEHLELDANEGMETDAMEDALTDQMDRDAVQELEDASCQGEWSNDDLDNTNLPKDKVFQHGGAPITVTSIGHKVKNQN